MPKFFNQQGLDKIKKEFPLRIMYGANQEDELVGCVIYKEANNKTIDISWIFIKKECHGKGVGTTLVEQSLAIERLNYLVCQVNTLAETVEDEGYARTRKFYEKLGFISVEIIDLYPGCCPGNSC